MQNTQPCGPDIPCACGRHVSLARVRAMSEAVRDVWRELEIDIKERVERNK